MHYKRRTMISLTLSSVTDANSRGVKLSRKIVTRVPIVHRTKLPWWSKSPKQKRPDPPNEGEQKTRQGTR